MNDIPPLTLVEIKWDDASALEHGWCDPEEEKPTPQWVQTVGFLVKQTEHHVVIAHTVSEGWANGRFQIPRAMIRSMKPIRKKRKPKAIPNGEASL